MSSQPPKLSLLAGGLHAYADDPFVTTPILKLLGDLVHNRSHRIVFAPASADGYPMYDVGVPATDTPTQENTL